MVPTSLHGPVSPERLITDLVKQTSIEIPQHLIDSLVDSKSVSAIQSIVSLKQALLPEGSASSTLPIRLKIPKIHVDAAVEYVGVTPQGAMGVPKGPANVAWFDPGPRPGEVGSAVIAGHYGWKDGVSAAFDNVYKLHKGDKLYIEDADGTSSSYVVRSVRLYGEYENASFVFNSNDGKAHLNLVTCEGVWNDARKSYSKRLVVFTDKEI